MRKVQQPEEEHKYNQDGPATPYRPEGHNKTATRAGAGENAGDQVAAAAAARILVKDDEAKQLVT